VELGVALGAMTFVQQNDRAGSHSPQNSRRDCGGIVAHRIEPAHRPANQEHVAPSERGMDEKVFQAGRAAEQTRRHRTLVNLRRDS